MSLRNFVKKHGRRIAGTWGRVNHKKDKRAAGKGIRKQGKNDIRRKLRYELLLRQRRQRTDDHSGHE
jgi:hypothetical protein